MAARTIETTYYTNSNNAVKTTRSVYGQSAVANVMLHMMNNDYGATVAEVTSLEHGELLAVLTYKPGDSIRTLFARDVTNPVCIVMGA